MQAPPGIGLNRLRPTGLGPKCLRPNWAAANRLGLERLRPCRSGLPRSARPRLVPGTRSGDLLVAPGGTTARADARPGVGRSDPPGAVRVGRVRHTCRLAVGPCTGCLPRATCASRAVRTSAGRRGIASALARLLRRTGLAEILDPVVVGVARSVSGRELVPVAARLAPEPTTLLTVGLLAASLRVAHGSHGKRPARMVGAEHRSGGDPGIGFGGNTPASRTGWPGVVVGVGPPQITVLRPSRSHYDCYSRD